MLLHNLVKPQRIGESNEKYIKFFEGMMKLLSVAIPCYNSEAYMGNVKKYLTEDIRVEIIIVDDSKDKH